MNHDPLANIDFDSDGQDHGLDFASMKSQFEKKFKDKIDSEIQKSKGSHQEAKKKLTFPLLPGQSMMDWDDIQSELDKARARQDKEQVISLIYTAVKRDIPTESKLKLYSEQLRLFQTLGLEKLQEECLNSLVQLNPDDLASRLKLVNLYTKKDKGFWESLVEFQSAQGLFNSLKDKSAQGVIQETRLMHLLKIEKMKDCRFEFFMRGKENVYGCLGRAEEIKQKVKEIIEVLWFANKTIKSITCGDHHTLAIIEHMKPEKDALIQLKAGESVMGFGYNYQGQVTGYKREEEEVSHKMLPSLIPLFEKRRVSHIAAKMSRSVCVTQNLEVYEWGGLSFDELDYQDKSPIRKIHQLDQKLAQMQIGAQFNLFLYENGEVYMSGNIDQPLLNENVFYSTKLIQLMTERRSKPPQPLRKITTIFTGYHHALLLDAEQSVWTVGAGIYGQLGLGFDEDHCGQPRLILNNAEITKITAGPHYCAAYSDYGIAYVWGLTIPNDLKSIKWFPSLVRVPDGVHLVELAATPRELLAFDSKGHYYGCDLSFQSRLTPHQDNALLASLQLGSIICGKTMQCLVKKKVSPAHCKIIEAPQQMVSLQTHQFELKIFQVKSEYFMASISQFPALSVILRPIQDASAYSSRDAMRAVTRIGVEKVANEESKEIATEAVKFKLSALNGNTVPGEMKLSINELNSSILNLDLIPDTKMEGMYSLTVLIQGEEIAGQPIELMLKKSVDQKKEEEEAEKRRHQRALQKMRKLQREKELKLKKEQERQRRLQMQQEEEQRRKEATLKRAQEAVKKLQAQQAKRALKEEEDRKMRKEMRTGGGFNMKKKKA